MKKLSIIIPCYNENKNIELLYKELLKEKKELLKVIKQLAFEIIYVNDGSKDDTLKEIKKLSINDSDIKYISLSRNFGKEASIYAGLKKATGDYIALMDADGQDPVYLLTDMLKILITEDYECVGCRRTNRKGEPIIRSFFAKKFYKIINKISETEIIDGARDYRMCTRKYVNSLLELSEYNRFSKGLFSWIGYKTKWLEYKNIERFSGSSKWSFWKLFKYSVDGVIAFSTTPLLYVSMIGFFICIFAVMFLMYIIISKVFFGNEVQGWTSLACLIIFIGGINVFSVGIISQYIARTYSEVKNRPIYIIEEDNIEEREKK